MRSASALLLTVLAALVSACGSSSGRTTPVSTLLVTVTRGGSVTGSPPSTSCSPGACSSAQPVGTQVTLTAAASPGWTFAGWSGDCAGAGSCAVTLSSNRSVAATFTANLPPAANLVKLSVNGTACGSGGGAYQNLPCVEVTVCLPGTSTCTTVNDVLLDTGSYGLRLFKEVLPASLPLATIAGGTLAECVQFLDGSFDWGPVANADVKLGGESSVNIPIQVIDATFFASSIICPKREASAAAAGFNGILGVGLFAEDCGAGCSTRADNGIYYACSGTACSGTTVPIGSQVTNPVARLPKDGNGVIVDLPSIPAAGQLSVEGWLVLGIDTQLNNGAAGATAYSVDLGTGYIWTTFDGFKRKGFLDTGSNGLFFPAPKSGSLPPCKFPDDGWYCPATTVPFSATNSAFSGLTSGQVAFSIGNAVAIFGSGNGAVDQVGGKMPSGSTEFDFGLPFFFGRRVYVGIEGTSSTSFGLGPYYAY